MIGESFVSQRLCTIYVVVYFVHPKIFVNIATKLYTYQVFYTPSQLLLSSLVVSPAPILQGSNEQQHNNSQNKKGIPTTLTGK